MIGYDFSNETVLPRSLQDLRGRTGPSFKAVRGVRSRGQA